MSRLFNLQYLETLFLGALPTSGAALPPLSDGMTRAQLLSSSSMTRTKLALSPRYLLPVPPIHA